MNHVLEHFVCTTTAVRAGLKLVLTNSAIQSCKFTGQRSPKGGLSLGARSLKLLLTPPPWPSLTARRLVPRAPRAVLRLNSAFAEPEAKPHSNFSAQTNPDSPLFVPPLPPPLLLQPYHLEMRSQFSQITFLTFYDLFSSFKLNLGLVQKKV